MSRSIQLIETVAAAANAVDYFSEKMDLTNYNGVSYSLNAGATAAGTGTLQISNDGTNWFDTTVTMTITAGKGILNSGLLFVGFSRLKINYSANFANAVVSGLGKES